MPSMDTVKNGEVYTNSTEQLNSGLSCDKFPFLSFLWPQNIRRQLTFSSTAMRLGCCFRGPTNSPAMGSAIRIRLSTPDT